MRRIGYARVSTAEQRHDRQILGLEALCDELHVETLSATSRRRPVYEAALTRLEPGDMLVVWDLDRAFRSVVDALTEAERLRGIHFRIANLAIDTTTPTGIFIYTMLSALAEFERRTLSQRTREGREGARRRGKRIGRPRALQSGDLALARQRIEQRGESIRRVARAWTSPPRNPRSARCHGGRTAAACIRSAVAG